MDIKLQNITSGLLEEMAKFEKLFKANFSSSDELLNNVLTYTYSLKGKRIRPLLAFLIAKIFGKVTDQTFRSAVIIELLHTASLLHDDVIDNSKLRRNNQTINSLFGDKTAILVGDYLYGKALATISTKEDFILMDVFAKIALQLPRGEIKETDVTTNKDTDLTTYLKVIHYKTASLISAAVECGARSCQNPDMDINELVLLGGSIGMAFQIRDDILDYDESNLAGKGLGNDIREMKITLPFIYYLETLTEKGKSEMLELFFDTNKEDRDVKTIISKVCESGAIERTIEKQKEYSDKAFKIIDNMPLNDYSVDLRALVQYLTIRNQ